MPPKDGDKEVVEEKVIEEPVQDEDPVEALATQIGWNPNHEGGDRPTLSAEEYILKSREIQDTSSRQIKKQKASMAKLENGLKALGEHNKSLYNAQVAQLRRTAADLKARRREAKDDDDTELVREIDGQLDLIGKVPTELPEAKPEEEDPRFTSWLDDNEWYEDDTDLRVYADVLAENPEYKALMIKDFEAGLKKVGETVRKMFPQKFNGGLEKQVAATVEGATRRTTTAKSKFKYSDLSREQQDLADYYEKHGIMEKAEYIKQLAEIAEAR